MLKPNSFPFPHAGRPGHTSCNGTGLTVLAVGKNPQAFQTA